MPEIKDKELVRYAFKGPGWGRKSFMIYLDVKSRDGKRTCKKIEDERLRAVNMAFQAGTMTLDQAIIQIKEIVQDLYKQDPRCRKKRNVHNNENWKIFEEFWQEVYSRKSLINEYSAKNDFKNTIEVLGPLSLISASRDEIQKRIDEKYKGTSQRRIVSRMRQLLKHIGREKVRLRMDAKDYSKVTCLTEEEFKHILSFAELDIEKTLMTLCFYSGLRIGEAYGLKPNCLLPDQTLRIAGQLDRSGVFRATKTKKPRIAFLFPAGLPAFNKWVSADPDEKAKIDRNDASRDLMKKYCKRAFPNDPSKHLTFHALRHCYAINMLSKGVSMSLVAQSLGNTLSVCEQYYVGFELTNDSIRAIKAIIEG